MSASSELRGRKIAVTGAGGFIGARVVEKLAGEHGAEVTAIVRRKSRAGRIAGPDVRIAEADLGDRDAIERAVAEQHTVINAAYDFQATGDENLRAFRNLAAACVAGKVGRIVQVSSIVVYDGWPDGDLSETSPSEKPGTDYKNAKMAMEAELATLAGSGTLTAAVIQPTIVYGPHAWIWTNRIVEQLAWGTLILPDPADGTCPAVYVDDVADAIILAAAREAKGSERYIVSGPEPTTWRNFFESYARMIGTGSIRYIDPAELRAGRNAPASGLRALIGNPLAIVNWGPARRAKNALRRAIGDARLERLRKSVIALRRRRGPLVYYPGEYELRLYLAQGNCRIDKARAELGYAPEFDFAAGMDRTAEYVRQAYPEFVEPDRPG